MKMLSVPIKQRLIFLALVIAVVAAADRIYMYTNTKWLIYREAENSFKQRQWDKAAQLYAESLSQGVDRPMAMARIGDAYMQINEFEKAIYWYRHYLAAQPQEKWAHRSLAQALTANGEFEAASKEYQAVISSSTADESEAK